MSKEIKIALITLIGVLVTASVPIIIWYLDHQRSEPKPPPIHEKHPIDVHIKDGDREIDIRQEPIPGYEYNFVADEDGFHKGMKPVDERGEENVEDKNCEGPERERILQPLDRGEEDGSRERPARRDRGSAFD